MSALNNSLLLGQEGGGGYAISRSVRLNSADSAFFSRTPASAGNRRTFTLSFWVKRTKLGMLNAQVIGVNEVTFTSRFRIVLDNSADKLFLFSDTTGTAASLTTDQVFRDTSAWYHFVVSVDTTQATASNRIKIYVNGNQITQFAAPSYPDQNNELHWNTAVAQYIGARNTTDGFYFDGYLADMHHCDGTAYDASAFGEFDANGIWQPKQFAGVYGSQGWHLDFSDNSTTAALGTDISGNGNTWSVNNLSVTAGAGNDSLVDVPTNGSEVDTGSGGQVKGNYCTLNPLVTGQSSLSLSNGNLDWSMTQGTALATIGISAGKYYWEVTANASNLAVGIALASVDKSIYIGYDGKAWGYYSTDGSKYNNYPVNGTVPYGASWTTGDIIGIAFDADNGTLAFYKNGVSQGQAFSGLTSGPYFPAVGNSSSAGFCNFGQRPFAYTAPSGFKALCTANLPAPVVTKPSTVMDVKLYTGNGGTQTISGLGFSPDFLWFKARSIAYSHALYDTVRGYTKSLVSNSTVAEGTEAGGLSAFNSDGFSLNGENTVYGSTNTNGQTYVAWAWDAGSSTVTNNSGSISSQVRTNGYLSIVTYTGTGANATVGHGLGIAPSMYIVKNRTGTAGFSDWYVYHTALGGGAYLFLNQTVASQSSTGVWNNTSPTSTVFSLGSGSGGNYSSANHVAYCFAPVAGYSSFGSYVGNGSSDGSFVYTGFRPKWILLKESSASGNNWFIYDTARNAFNVCQSALRANISDAELTTSNINFDILSNGFKPRNSDSFCNGSGATYIYAAFAESPFQ
jgi:hypothetical protein